MVGIGPGDGRYLTEAARAALEEADVLCGYTLYVELLKPLWPEKATYSTGMTGEMERCRWCLEQAAGGKTVALVCSGDAGIYGMAAPVLELRKEYGEAEVEIIPGITAALSGGAMLGAPLGHDFCVISLSDRLTDWAQIEERLRCAASPGTGGTICSGLATSCSRKRARKPSAVWPGPSAAKGRASGSFRFPSCAVRRRICSRPCSSAPLRPENWTDGW